MDVDSLQHSIAASITANATIEAARITASATVEASKNTLLAAAVAIVAGFSAIVAAYVNTWQSRQTYKAEREAYRHLIGGLLTGAKSEVGMAAYIAQRELDGLVAGRPSIYTLDRIDLAKDLSEENWRQHALLGPRFARNIVKLRDQLRRHNQDCESHREGWDLKEKSRGLMSTEWILRRHLKNIRDAERVIQELDATTRTLFERLRTDSLGLLFRIWRRFNQTLRTGKNQDRNEW